MKRHLFVASCLLVIIPFFYSCSKNGDDPIPDNPNIPVDTLSAGWTLVNMPLNIDFLDIFFTSDKIGFVGGNKYLAKTTDGGLTWQKLPISDVDSFTCYNIFFIDINHGWVVSRKNGVYRTTDGGVTWSNSRGIDAIDVFFVDQNNGYVLGSGAGMFRTNNGGQTWAKIESLSINMSTFFSKDVNNGWVVTWDGQLYKTSDGFSNVSLIGATPLLKNINYIQFADDLNAWATGFYNAELSRTTDGGVTWAKMFPTVSGVKDIALIDNKNGFVLRGQEIYQSSDGGLQFNRVAKVNRELIEIFFLDNNHGWACGQGGLCIVLRNKRIFCEIVGIFLRRVLSAEGGGLASLSFQVYRFR